MNLKSKQKGMSPITVLVMCIALAGVILVVLKLGPHYLDYSNIRKVFNAAAEAPGAESIAFKQLYKNVNKGLLINNIRDFDFKDSAYIDKSDGTVVYGFEYEIRDNMAFNIDTVLMFSHEVEVEVKSQ